MAPEQAQGRRKDFGPATDVHALGAILYELLTGRPPFQGATAVDTLVQVSFEDPIPPGRLRADLPRDLETVCLKCLQKDPRHRYPTARALAADLRRFLNREPIEAQPTTLGGRVMKWARRRPLLAGLAATTLLLTVVSLVSLSWALAVQSGRRAQAEANERRETDLRRQAQHERARAERLSAAALLDQAVSQGDHGLTDRALLLLVRSLDLANRVGDADLERAARINLTAWRGRLVRQRAWVTHPHWLWAVAYSPDGQTFATASRDQTARLWNTATGTPVGDPMTHELPVWAVAYSPDGATLATGTGLDRRGEVRLWDARTGRPLGPPLAADQPVTGLTFAPDGRVLLAVGGGRARLWRPGAGGPPVSFPHPGGVRSAALSPDGRRVLTGGADGTARLWTAAGADLGVALRHDRPDGSECRLDAVAFSADGETIATGSPVINKERRLAGGEVRLWRAGREPLGEPLGDPLPHRGPLKALAFSPDGRRLLTSGIVLGPGPDELLGEARLWDVDTGRPLGPALEQAKPVWSVAFSPDGRTFVTGCEDGSVGFWVTATGLPAGQGHFHPGNVTAIAVAPDGRTAVTSRAYEPGAGRLWELPPGRGALLAPVHTGPVRAAGFAASGRVLLTAGDDGQLARWDADSGRPLGPPLRHLEPIIDLVLSADGAVAATVGRQAVRLWDAAAGRPLGEPLVRRHANAPVALSADGRRVLIGTEANSARLWDVATGRSVGEPLGHDSVVSAAAFHPAGGIVATGSLDHTARLWDADTGRPVGKPLAHGHEVTALAFRPDGRVLASAARDNLVRQWDVPSGQPVGPPLPLREVGGLVYSPDGRVLLTASGGTAWLWDVEAGRALGPPLAHRGGITGLFVSPDGRTAATTCSDRGVRLWDVATGHQLGPPLWHPGPIPAAAFRPDGRVLVTGGEDGLVRLWELPGPATGDVAALHQWVEALTGMQMAKDGAMRELDPATPARQQEALRRAGPEPFREARRLP
jgi:WD40 repeat protein